MKRLPIVATLLLSALATSAEEKRSTSSGASSSSVSSTSYTEGSGNTVTTTTTERDGKRETRRTVTGPGGKVISETTDNGDEAKPGAKPGAEKGKPGGPWLGVHATELPPAMREQLDIPEGTGLLIEQLPPDSPAGNAGIAQHDILLTLNLTPVGTPEQLRAELAKHQPGAKVLVEYLRKNRREKAAVTLGKRAGDTPPGQQANAAEPTGDAAIPAIPGMPALPKLPGLNGNATTGATTKTFSRTVIVGPDGKTRVIEKNGDGDPIEQMLRDPNLPEAMKESLRKMQEQMRDIQKRSEGTPAGNAKPGGKASD